MTLVRHHDPDCDISRNVQAVINASGEPTGVVEGPETRWTHRIFWRHSPRPI